MKFFVISLIISLFCYACSQTTPPKDFEKVKFDGPTITSLKPYFKSIEVVKLDHQNNITLGVWNLIRQHDSSFYIIDMNRSNTIYRFGRHGEFLDSIGKKGRGPAEFQRFLDFYVDNHADEVYIQSLPNLQLYKYDKKGHFISKKSSAINATSFTKEGEYYWIYAGHSNLQQPERVVLTDSSLNVLKKLLPLPTKTLQLSVGPQFSRWKDENYLAPCFDRFVYKISGDTLFPLIEFDFGEYSIPESYWKAENAMEAATTLMNRGFTSLTRFSTTDDYIFAEFNFQQGEWETMNYYLCGIKSKKDNQWNWLKKKIYSSSKEDKESTSVPDWYITRTQGFTQDGKLMVFLFAHEIELLKSEDMALIQNPELLQDADEDMDMFLLLCSLK